MDADTTTPTDTTETSKATEIHKLPVRSISVNVYGIDHPFINLQIQRGYWTRLNPNTKDDRLIGTTYRLETPRDFERGIRMLMLFHKQERDKHPYNS